jgi:hypothetical protein
MQVRIQRTAPAMGDVKIRLMQPGDARGVSGLMREVYGETYPKKYVYDPARIEERSTRGDIVPAVATGPLGNVVGYGALSAYYGYPEIGLIGSLAVSPALHGRGIGGEIVRYLADGDASLGFQALTGGAFTAHPYSQRILEKEGFCPSAILLGSQPKEIAFRGISENLAQRESTVFCTRVILPREYEFQYLPANHRQMIRQISRELGIRIAADGTGNPGKGPSVIDHTLNAETGNGMIWVRSTGCNYREAFAATVGQLLAGGAGVIRLHLNMSDPGSTAVVSEAEKTGFIFAGILPGQHGLILLLQHLRDIRLDLQNIHMGGNLCGERLLSYIGSRIQKNTLPAQQYL